MTDKRSAEVAEVKVNGAHATSNAGGVKDEAAVNREIAALLLNLHANNGRSVATNVPKAEDLSLKSSVETAIGNETRRNYQF